jgi:hypothetical protein
MTAQVVFLNRAYRPTEEEIKELEKMQEFLTFCNIQYLSETKHLDDKIRRAQKEKVHKNARERLGIVFMVKDK